MNIDSLLFTALHWLRLMECHCNKDLPRWDTLKVMGLSRERRKWAKWLYQQDTAASCPPLCFVGIACSAGGLIHQQFCHSSTQLNLFILSAPWSLCTKGWSTTPQGARSSRTMRNILSRKGCENKIARWMSNKTGRVKAHACLFLQTDSWLGSDPALTTERINYRP